MNNFSSDTNFSKKDEENDYYEQYLRDMSSGNTGFKALEDGQNFLKTTNLTDSNNGSVEKVAEKVEGVPIPESPIIDNDSESMDGDLNENDSIPVDSPDSLVGEWEADNNKELSKTFRTIALHAAYIHVEKGRGITVQDLIDKGFGKDHAEKLLPQAVKLSLLIRLDNRIGKQYQYSLSNYIHTLNSEEKKKNEKEKEILPYDVSLILACELSGMKYAYHNIHLETKLNHKEDYQSIPWPIKSAQNNQKVQTFRLGPKRSVNFVVSATGTVNISIECTLKPYEFHTAIGSMSFFGTCGQVLSFLQLSTKNRINVVPDYVEWYLTRFDYNKDIPTKDLKAKYHSNGISWTSKGVLKLKHIGTIFQIYCKEMPYVGECLRSEGHFTTKEKVKIRSIIPDIVAGDDDKEKHPFTTIEEMLIQRRSNGMHVSPTLQKVKSMRFGLLRLISRNSKHLRI